MDLTVKLKVGLLICDDAKTTVEHSQGTYPDMFRKLFAEYPKLKLIPFDMRKFEEPDNLDELDGFISTGSSFSVYEDVDWIKHFESLVQRLYQHGSKFFGVCFDSRRHRGTLHLLKSLPRCFKRLGSVWHVSQ